MATIKLDRETLGRLYENWQENQHLLVDNGFVVPWSFDDLDPKTDFDEKVRQKAKELIDKVSSREANVKTSQGEAEFKMSLAYGIFNEALADPFFLGNKVPLIPKKDDDPDFAKFGCPAYEPPKESTALELLQTKVGTCSESTYVLMGLYYMAGLNVRAIDVTVLGDGEFVDHVALQVEIGAGQFVVVDPSLHRFNTHYQAYIPLSPAEFASVYYSSLGGTDKNKEADSYQKAELLSGRTETISTVFQYFRDGQGEVGLSLLKRLFTGKDDPRPDLLYTAYLREHGYVSEYVTRLADIRKRYPDVIKTMEVYLSKSFYLGHFSMAGLLSVLFDVAETEEEASDVLNMAAAYFLLSGNIEKGRTIIMGLMKGDVVNEKLFNTYAYSLCRSKKFDEFYDVVKQWRSRFPHSVRAREYVMTAGAAKGDFDQAIQAGVSLFNEEKLSVEGLKHLALAIARKGDPMGGSEMLSLYLAFHKVEDAEAKRDLFLLCATLAAAAGDYNLFETRYKTAASIRESDFFEIIDLYLKGEVEKARIAKGTFIKKEGGESALRDFVTTFDFLPKGLLEFLSRG